MPELLLELFSEEIPARMQQRAGDDLARAVNKALMDAGFMPEDVKSFAGPRRLVCIVGGLPARQPDRREEKKGPRVGAPEKAVEGFLKSAGLSSLDQCETRSDKKGEFYVAVIEQAGRDTAAVIAELLSGIIRGFSWPKSMRWSDGDLRWVRPLHRILCVFNDEPVPFEIEGVTAGDETEGHRFMAPGVIQARSFEDYSSKLRAAHVILDGDERKEMIAADAATLCNAQGLELVDDPALLNEVAGLAEWPVALMGSFDEKFLKLPDEVLTASMRGHQKYFSVRDPKTGRLANKFVCVANITAPDGGAAMRTGYERVLTARLSDGWYLYNQDLKTPLEDRIVDLDKVTFFEGLGSVGDKARRVAALAKEIAPAVGADPAAAGRAAMLAKADLVSQMVYEFPELQGVMGRYYAIEQGEPEAIVDAIRDHYKPSGQDDDVPTAPVSVAVALADKIDTLTAFWAIDKKPTGSSDPFALRRAALGWIQYIENSKIRLRITNYLEVGVSQLLHLLDWQFLHELFARVEYNDQPDALTEADLHWIRDQVFVRRYIDTSGNIDQAIELRRESAEEEFKSSDTTKKLAHIYRTYSERAIGLAGAVEFVGNIRRQDEDNYGKEDLLNFREENKKRVAEFIALFGKEILDLLVFFHDRLKVYLRDKGHRHDRIDAVLTDTHGNLQDDLVLIVAKLEALESFLKTDDGENLVAAYKRAANILKAEEKKKALPDDLVVNAEALEQTEEKALFAALETAEGKAREAVVAEDFETAMTALASLRSPLDAFFEAVTVNADDAALRANRLALLQRFIKATEQAADFSKLEG